MSSTPPRWVDPLVLLGLFLGLLGLTWMRWPDALVDFWRNLYIPWRLSEGALLYRDVTDWYGPLPSLVAGAGFSLFGAGLDVLVALNTLVALGCLMTLHRSLLRVGDRLSAFVGSAAFVLVFCFAQYTAEGNYNFITPYVSHATWGFFGLLLVLQGALFEESPLEWLLAGVGLGITWLSKAETLLAVGVVLLGVSVLRRRLPPARFALGFGVVMVPVALLLAAQGGLEAGARAFTQVISFTLSAQTRATLAAVPIFGTDLGVDAPLQNLLSHGAWGLTLLGVGACLSFGPRFWQRSAVATLLVGVIAASALITLTPWLHVGRALLFPALLTAGVTSVAVIKGHRRAGPLWLLSLAAVAMMPRMLLNVRIFHYGFTMAVLAMMVVVHLLVFEVPRFGVTAGEPPRLAVALCAAGLVLAGSARLVAHTLELNAAKTLQGGRGRDAFLAFPEHRNSLVVNDMVAAVEKFTPAAKTLVVFPDSAAVSYLTRRPSPVPEFEFNPVSLGFAGGADAVLERLQAHPPDVVLFCSYDLRSHGTPFFGATRLSGERIIDWVKLNYRRVASGPPGPFSITSHAWDLFERRPAPATP